MLANGMGGLDWAGLPLVVELLGIDDVDTFLQRLMTIKTYRPDKEEDEDKPKEA